MTIKAIGHLGFCVSDLDRALRFWCEGLGFKVLREFEFFGSKWRRIVQLDTLDLKTRIIRRDHMTLEILWFKEPGYVGNRQIRPMNQIGFTHLAVWVRDIEDVAKRVVEYGGTVVEDTRTEFDYPHFKGKWLICTDPDGIRIELVEYPEGEDVLEP